ncbi:unnamed protein product [Closterium sp. Naga37s-1]|nr:unnamed protein product [Closterium sp. Naga37s-1]
MTTAQGRTSARVASAAASSAYRQAAAQSLTSAGAEIAQATAPPPSSDGGGRPDEGDGGSTPPAGNEARLTPENEIIGVCRSGDPSTITIAPDWNGQTWRGWGTSLAWFANYVGKLPDDQFNLVMDLLFDKDKGIGLNLARYLIGGSVNYINSPQFLTAAWETCSIPGFRVQPNGPYDWTADGRQRRTMLAALARSVDEVEAISYSPPWWMTVSGDTAGSVQGKSNLKPEYFQAYTEYQASVIEHYRTHWNVTFSTMNPANEALEGWKRKLPTRVAGFDSFLFATRQYTYKFPAALKAGLFRFNVHAYIPPPPNTTDTRRHIEVGMVSMHHMATGLGKEVWLSEVGPMWHCIAAFFHPDQHFVSIFIVNQRDTTHPATFQFDDFVPFDAGRACVVETYRTSATENNTLVTSQSYADVPASIQVAALGSSMTSVVLRNVDPR